MKKILVLALAVVMMVSAFALVACAPQEKVAYGLVHGQGYVGKATVTVSGSSLKSATLDEACLPTYVTAAEAIDGYTVSAEVTSHGQTTTKYFYKTVKFADVEMVYDATNGYQVGTTKMLDWFAVEANCEKWFEAVAANNVSVVLASGDDKTILTADKLLKSKNGYWGTPAETALGWKANVEATCAYVVEYGFGGATAKDDFVVNAGTGALDNEWKDANGVLTGATWSDMWDYYSLLKAAYEK